MSGRVQLIEVSRLILDAGTQMRVEIDEKVVQEYADIYREGGAEAMPPLGVVESEDGRVWVWDGHHRTLGALAAGIPALSCLVQPGGLEDAQWMAVSANKGLRRSNPDKRRAVECALLLAPHKSDREIARWCGVSNRHVADVRRELESGVKISHLATRLGADGKVYPASPKKPKLDKTKSTSRIPQSTERLNDDDSEVISDDPVETSSEMPQETKDAETAADREPDGAGEPAADDSGAAESPAEPAGARDALTDSLGIPVGEHSRSAFAVLLLIAHAKSLLRQLIASVHAIATARGGERFARDATQIIVRNGEERHVSPLLDQFWDRLRYGTPYACVCPYCWATRDVPTHPDCKACYGHGYVTEAIWKAAPEDYRDLVTLAWDAQVVS